MKTTVEGLVFSVVRVFIRAKAFLRKRNKQKEGVLFEKCHCLNSKVNIYFHKLQFEDNQYDLKVVTSKNKNTQDDNIVQSQVLKNVDKCNAIVYCCLMDSNDGMVELTNLFREFVFHFDETNDESRLGYFLEFAGHHFDIPVSDISDMDFVVYMNDDDFSEHRFPACEVLSGGHVFKDILALNSVVC
jgi:hypothetical protein